MRRLPSFVLSVLILPGLVGPLVSQTTIPHTPPHRAAEANELRAALAFDAARSSPLELHAFLARMPKGADLHLHLSGAVYAETFLHNAVTDHLCLNPTRLSFTPASAAASSDDPPGCSPGDLPAAAAFKDQQLYDALIDSFSMRGFVPTPGTTGHDQFFSTFGRFGGLDKSHTGEWLDEVAARAAAQNEQYLEVMQTPSFKTAAATGYSFPWPAAMSGTTLPAHSTPTTTDALAQLRRQLLAAPGFADNLALDRTELSAALASRSQREHCAAAEPAPASQPSLACAVQIRFLGQVLRSFPPQQVFAQTLLYFELASTDPDVVGINFVQPEDTFLSMSEYHRQMLMLDYLHGVYPGVHIALHAGELAPGLVPPEGLRFHIREAVELGHAERIGHGVDLLYEDDPAALLRQIAARHIMVEINLTSNEGILGIAPPLHPLPEYRAAHVPLALSTDDEGVSRIDLTHEYVRAALDFHLTYIDLKQMARTSLEHAFLPGTSLWSEPDAFARPAPPCASQPLGVGLPAPACAAFLAASPRAAQQWELEHRFRTFEATFPKSSLAPPATRARLLSSPNFHP